MTSAEVSVADERTRDGTAEETRRAWWSAWPLHPLLFAAYPVLFLFAANVGEQLSVEPMLGPLLAAVVGTLVVLVVLRLLFRDWLRAGLATTVLVALFFSYGHVRTASDAFIEGGIRQRYLLAGWGLLLVVGLVAAWRLRRGVLASTTTALNVLGAVLVAINTVPIVQFQVNAMTRGVIAPEEPVVPDAASGVERRPDIYYIVFDRYSSADTLREVYGFDNTPFLEELERRGFYVADESDANYIKTILSLTSSLNMDYLDVAALAEEADSREDLKPVYRRMASAQAVQAYLKSLGYSYVHIGSRFQTTSTNSAADRVLLYDEESEFNSVLAETTLLSAASTIFPEQELDPFLHAWRFTNYQFEQLERLASEPGPKFVFVHFTVPHPPFVHDADCDFVSEAEQKERGRRLGFVEMVQCTNRRALEVLDTLQGGPEEDRPVILIQADEGHYPLEPSAASAEGRWEDATPDELREKYGILNAYYLPGTDYEGLYETITPVNSFRVVFNNYYGTDLELLPDRVYAPFHVNQAFEQFEITDIVRGGIGDPAP